MAQIGMFRTMSSSSHRRPLLVSFSGLDGFRQNYTQIAEPAPIPAPSGITHLSCLAFWDDVVVMTRYREGFVHKVYGSEKGIGAPASQSIGAIRMFASGISVSRDMAFTCWTRYTWFSSSRPGRRSDTDVVILDRYIYDELANLPLSNPFTRLFIRVINSFVPRPDVAYLLDVDPEAREAAQAGISHRLPPGLSQGLFPTGGNVADHDRHSSPAVARGYARGRDRRGARPPRRLPARPVHLRCSPRGLTQRSASLSPGLDMVTVQTCLRAAAVTFTSRSAVPT